MVRNHDSSEEIPNISAVNPNSFDVENVDYSDQDDEAATYTIEHVNTTTPKSSPVMLNYNIRRGTRRGGGKELVGKEQDERQLHTSTSEIPTKLNRTGLRCNTNFTAWKRKKDSKIVGLKHYGLESPRHQLHNTLSDLDDHYSSNSKCHATSQPLAQPKRSFFTWLMRDHHHQQTPYRNNNYNNSNISETTPTNFNVSNGVKKNRLFAVEKEEEMVRSNVTKNPFILFYLGNLAAIKVLIYYFITLETVLSCTVTTGLTMYWYNHHSHDSNWDGNSLNFILVAFTLTAPMTAALTMAFTRREQALMFIADFRSFSYHLYLAHALWDWDDANGGRIGTSVDLVDHCDAVLAQLIGIGDELSRFLSLPSTSRSRHRHTKSGRQEAARTIEVAYHLLDSMATQRLTRLVIYSERLKKIGLPSGEISRVRQYERFISSVIEQLRMLKLYRTPQAFRSFARIFTLILPPFYAPTFAQVAVDVDSLGVGIAFGIITALGLVALFESHQILEDPFTAYLALDGIDVREEFEVLHYAQLINTRKLVFPDAPVYPAARRAALTSQSMRFKKNKKRLSPVSTILCGEALPNSPSNNTTTVPIVSLSSSSTTCLVEFPPKGDKYTSMFTANEEDVEVGCTRDDAINNVMATDLNVNHNEGIPDAHTADTDDDDDDDDIELGTFLEDDDHTHRESIFVQPEQVSTEPDRYSHYHHSSVWNSHRRHATTSSHFNPSNTTGNNTNMHQNQGFLRSRHNIHTTTRPAVATTSIL